jgi:dTDP-4-dehydrorhamnose reductase
MRILLTGPDGQIGWELRRTLPSLGEVCALPRNELDLGRLDGIEHAIHAIQPDLIVNAAGYTAVDLAESETDLANRINGDALHTIGTAARRIGAAVVHYSTDYVFDGAARHPYTPDAPTNPINAYGRSKLLGEAALRDSGAEHLILRTSWVYSLRRKNFLLTMLRLASERDELRVVDDQHGSPTWSRSIARSSTAILRAAVTVTADRTTLSHGGVYHLSCAGQATWFGFAEAIFNHVPPAQAPRVIPITTDAYPTPAARPAYSVLDCTATERDFSITLDRWEDAVAEAMRDHTPTSTPAHAEESP